MNRTRWEYGRQVAAERNMALHCGEIEGRIVLDLSLPIAGAAPGDERAAA